jgi:hypothetical protein
MNSLINPEKISGNEALKSIIEILDCVQQWPHNLLSGRTCQKAVSGKIFRHKCGQDRIMGAIEGCHIRTQRPRSNGNDYINRKGYQFFCKVCVMRMEGSSTFSLDPLEEFMTPVC